MWYKYVITWWYIQIREHTCNGRTNILILLSGILIIAKNMLNIVIYPLAIRIFQASTGRLLGGLIMVDLLRHSGVHSCYPRVSSHRTDYLDSDGRYMYIYIYATPPKKKPTIWTISLVFAMFWWHFRQYLWHQKFDRMMVFVHFCDDRWQQHLQRWPVALYWSCLMM